MQNQIQVALALAQGVKRRGGGAQVAAGCGRLVASAVMPSLVPYHIVFSAAVPSDGAATALVRSRWGAWLCLIFGV